MMNGSSTIGQPEGVHQRTMSAEEGEDHDAQQQLPLLDPGAIRPLEMDLGTYVEHLLAAARLAP